MVLCYRGNNRAQRLPGLLARDAPVLDHRLSYLHCHTRPLKRVSGPPELPFDFLLALTCYRRPETA